MLVTESALATLADDEFVARFGEIGQDVAEIVAEDQRAGGDIDVERLGAFASRVRALPGAPCLARKWEAN